MIFGNECVLGVHPLPRGFGWALFEGPDALYDWATASVPRGDNVRATDRVCALLSKYEPRVLAVEEFEDAAARRCPRVRDLYRMIVICAEDHGIRVHRYSRREIAQALSVHGAFTREVIANAVASRVKALGPLVPRRRKLWESEHPRMAVFSAAACVMTYYANQKRG